MSDGKDKKVDNGAVEEAEMLGNRNWYTLSVYVGQEESAMKNLLQRAEALEMSDMIYNVVVPSVNKFKFKGGKKVEVNEKIYPGYIFVDMELNDKTIFLVRGTAGVIGFVSANGEPIPLSEKDIEFITQATKASSDKKHDAKLSVGEVVMVVDGPFSGHKGRVSEVDSVKGRVKVDISMFGRDVSVDLDMLQVQKV